MNGTGIRNYVCDLEVTDHINHSGFGFNSYARARRHVHHQIDPVGLPPFANRNLTG